MQLRDLEERLADASGLTGRRGARHLPCADSCADSCALCGRRLAAAVSSVVCALHVRCVGAGTALFRCIACDQPLPEDEDEELLPGSLVVRPTS
jgi:hypothetical protein